MTDPIAAPRAAPSLLAAPGNGAPDTRLGIAGLLWIALLSLCWLLPSKFPPWMTFDLELTAAVAVLVLAGALLWRGGAGRWPVPWPAVLAAGLATVPLAQWVGGLITYSGDAMLAALFIAGFAGAVLVGARAAQRLDLRWPDALFGAVALAAVLSTALALYQWLGLDGLGDAAADLAKGSRPYANFGQPNHLATLLGWGLMALWWHWRRGHLPGWAATALAAYLLVGVASTQSRTAWLFMGLLAAGALVFHRPLGSRRAAPVLVGLAIGFVLLVSQWERIDAALGLQVAQPLEERLKAGLRWSNWQILLDGIAQQPWFGYGWQQVHAAQQAALLDHPKTLEPLDHSHNLVLDLLIWNGVPLGGLVAGLGLVWWWRTGRRARRQDAPAAAITFLALSVSLVHAMLEYPHSYAYFLLPAGLMVGSLCVWAGSRVDGVAAGPRAGAGAGAEAAVQRLEPSLPRGVVAALALATAAILVLINHDFRAARAQLEAQRFQVMNLANPNAAAPGEASVNHSLTQLRDFLDPPRAVIGQPPDAAELERLRRFALRYPQRDSMMEYAKAQAQVGDITGASRTMQRFCHLMTDERCEQVRAYWSAMVQGRWPELAPVRF